MSYTWRVFTNTFLRHLQSGCKKCGIITVANKCRSNTKEFIEKAKKIHGDKYKYSKVDYKTSSKKVIIICPIHGEFLQTPSGHLGNKGCIKCGFLTTANYRRSNTKEFIEKARIKHGDKYDYSKTNYVKAKVSVIIICPIHGEFSQTPSDHLNGGCNECGWIIGKKTTI